jgi:ribosomal protein S4
MNNNYGKIQWSKDQDFPHFREPILGNGKWLGKNSNPPGMHGEKRKRKTLGEYALQLREKQKAKYTYGILENNSAKLLKKLPAAEVLRVKT